MSEETQTVGANGAADAPARVQKTAPVMRSVSLPVPKSVMDVMAGSSDGRTQPPPVKEGNFENSMACYRCYVKHLSKAAVLADEVAEEPGRDDESVMCIGNIAAAEDHAEALGLFTDRERLREMRSGIWEGKVGFSADLRRMASAALRAGIAREIEERHEEARLQRLKALSEARRLKDEEEKKKAADAKDAPAAVADGVAKDDGVK